MVRFYTPQVVPLKNGKYELSIRYRDESFVGIKKKAIRLSKDTAYARGKGETTLKKRIKDSLSEIEYKDITFGELKDKLISNMEEQGLAYKTIETYKANLNVINRTFKDQIVSTIKAVAVNRYLNNALYKENLSNGTVHSFMVLFFKMFNYAEQFGYLKDNPNSKIKVNYRDESKKKLDKIENWYLTDDEFKILMDYCDEKKRPDYKEFFQWLYLTGMRIGEGSAIQVKDILKIDDTYYADVNGTLICKKGWRKQPFTKTVKGMRKVSLPDQAVELYQKHKVDKKDDDYLFTNMYSHGPLNVSSVDRWLGIFNDKESLTKDISSHIFRHTHVSKLAEAGFPLPVISDRVGHENEETTRKIYLHITKKVHKKYDDKIKKFSF